MEVQCRRCKLNKPASDFCKHSQNTNGLQAYCKACVTAYNRDHGYHSTQQAKYRVTQRSRHPEKWRAWVAVYNNRKRGRLVRSPCEVCGDQKSQAHHDDYTKPLAVRWLCRPHHLEHHAKARSPA